MRDSPIGLRREASAVFLLRTHGHARHGHRGHVHLSQVAATVVHVHHAVGCRGPLGSKLLLGKGAEEKKRGEVMLLPNQSRLQGTQAITDVRCPSA